MHVELGLCEMIDGLSKKFKGGFESMCCNYVEKLSGKWGNFYIYPTYEPVRIAKM